jgi:hypothetical protein
MVLQGTSLAPLRHDKAAANALARLIREGAAERLASVV